MSETSAFNNFPRQKIKPFDGMAITAEIWAEAHDEHRKKLQAHDLFFHGAGIVSGLEVVANDPPDQYVFISPGLAVDTAGNVIVLTEPVAYDFGSSMEGELYLMLGHGEREVAGDQKELRYLQSEFVVAARPTIPKRPAVELARVFVSKRGNSIKNAPNPLHPGIEEIDMRYRSTIGNEEKKIIKIGVCYLSGEVPAGILIGWDYLSREAKRTSPYCLVTDNALPISPQLLNYSILYLAGTGSFKVENNKAKELTAYIEQEKAIIAEALDDAADESFKTLFSTLGVNLKLITEHDAILKSPHLFTAPPDGNQGNRVMLGNKVIYSTAQYSLSWTGKVAGGRGSRADIRSALEWGINMINYCV